MIIGRCPFLNLIYQGIRFIGVKSRLVFLYSETYKLKINS